MGKTFGEVTEAMALRIQMKTVDLALDLEKYAKRDPLGAADLQRRVVRGVSDISHIRTTFTLGELEEMGFIQKAY